MRYGNMTNEEARAELQEFLDRQPNAPFLFMGSGISQRYMGTETWSDLLELFCSDIQPYDFYRGRSGSELPLRASFIAKDYYDWWWKNQTLDIKRKYAGWCNSESDPLKIDISEYLKNKSAKLTDDPNLLEELKVLKEVRVAGIITTNWDSLLEILFPDYTVFVGQESMITGRVHGIGEIYIIHGSCTSPTSLVLTKEDYDDFNRKRAYLAAKLMTIFVEHPIIFFGYRLNDENILQMLNTIGEGMGDNERELLKQNLIFVRRHKESHDKSQSYIQEANFITNGHSIDVTEIFTSDFKTVYQVLSDNSLKIPPKILRFFKEQSYELIMSKDPTERLKVTDIENIDKFSELSFVVGVGAVASQYADKGFSQISIFDLAQEILIEDKNFPHEKVIDSFRGASSTQFFPIFKYISQCNFSTKDEAKSKYPWCIRFIDNAPGVYQTSIYKKRFEQDWADRTTRYIIDNNTAENAAVLIAFQDKENVDIGAMKEFLCDNIDKIKTKASYSTYYRKLLCYYDWVVFCPWHSGNNEI